jgi:hypothetical protein
MLVVMEDGDIHPLLQFRLDGEAFRRLDILQIDPAEGRLQQRDRLDELLRIGRVHFYVEHVDVGELLEKDRLALHHRLGRKGTDRT